MSYKRVILDAFGGPEVLRVVEESVLPEPGVGEVRLKVLATSATFTDTMIRKGIYFGFKEKPPFSPGYDVIGVVDKVGPGVSGFTPGERVADLTVYGAYAEYILRPASSLVPVPAGLDSAEAVSLVLSYITAYQMLHRVAKVQRGERILIHGAGGAVGTAMLQLGGLLDLKMYGTASAAKRELVERLGAAHVDYTKEDFAVRIRSEGGVDAAFDAVSGENFKRSFHSLKKDGILVAYGMYANAMGQGGNPLVDFAKIAIWNLLPNGRRASIYSIGGMRQKHPDWFKEDLCALFGLLGAGKVKPVIARRMRLEEAGQAHALIERAAVKGRIVLMVGEEGGGGA